MEMCIAMGRGMDNTITVFYSRSSALRRYPYPREICQLFDGRVSLADDIAKRIELRLHIG